MPDHPLDFLPPDAAARDTAALDRRARGATDPDDSGLLAATDREHLEREIAAIERASAALRRAEPELESWVDSPPATLRKPRPVWLLVGALWLSTALVTLGAAFAISVLVGVAAEAARPRAGGDVPLASSRGAQATKQSKMPHGLLLTARQVSSLHPRFELRGPFLD
jgi:hypothetical protein